MRYVKVEGDETREDLEHLMTHLRQMQAGCRDELLRKDIGKDVDEAIELWIVAPTVPAPREDEPA